MSARGTTYDEHPASDGPGPQWSPQVASPQSPSGSTWWKIGGFVVAGLIVVGVVVAVLVNGSDGREPEADSGNAVPAASTPARAEPTPDEAIDVQSAQAKLLELQASFANMDRLADLVGSGACPLMAGAEEWGGEVRGGIYCSLPEHSDLFVGLFSAFDWPTTDAMLLDLTGHDQSDAASDFGGGQVEARCESGLSDTGFTVAPDDVRCAAVWRRDDLVVALVGADGVTAAEVRAALVGALPSVVASVSQVDLAALRPG